MQTKDYYTILELPPSATFDEIKKAYRRLAHQYHPDKNGNEPYAAAQFEIIKEAYEVLTNPSKRDWYLQQRWYDQSAGKRKTGTATTPVTILKQVLELDKYIARIDVHRMDKGGLFAYIGDVLSDEIIEKLNSFNERDINKSIITSILKCSHPLPLNYALPLSVRLLKINSDESSVRAITEYIHHSRQVYRWDKYKPWLISLAVILLCILIYLLGHQGYLD